MISEHEEDGSTYEGVPQASDHETAGAGELDRGGFLGRGLLLTGGQEPLLELGEP